MHPLWKMVWWFLNKLNIQLPHNPAIPLLDRTEIRCSSKNVCQNIHNSTIQKGWTVETTQMSISWWMDKQNMVYLYNRIFFPHKKEWNTDTCYNMDEPWNTMLSERNQSQEATYASIIWNIKNRQLHRYRKEINDCHKLEGEGDEEYLKESPFWSDVMFWN